MPTKVCNSRLRELGEVLRDLQRVGTKTHAHGEVFGQSAKQLVHTIAPTFGAAKECRTVRASTTAASSNTLTLSSSCQNSVARLYMTLRACEHPPGTQCDSCSVTQYVNHNLAAVPGVHGSVMVMSHAPSAASNRISMEPLPWQSSLTTGRSGKVARALPTAASACPTAPPPSLPPVLRLYLRLLHHELRALVRQRPADVGPHGLHARRKQLQRAQAGAEGRRQYDTVRTVRHPHTQVPKVADSA